MTSRNVEAVIAKIELEEGGVTTLNDGAGETRWGQTQGWLDQFDLPVPTTAQEAAENWRRWMAITHLDQVCDLEPRLGFIVADFEANAGRGIRALQDALLVKADGVIGPQTLAALKTADLQDVRCHVVAARARAYGDALHNPTNAQFARGWMTRLAESIDDLSGLAS